MCLFVMIPQPALANVGSAREKPSATGDLDDDLFGMASTSEASKLSDDFNISAYLAANSAAGSKKASLFE